MTDSVPFSKIPAMQRRWCGPWFPIGTPVLYVAPAGTGKGLSMALDIAIVATGAAWPGEPEGTLHQPKTVLLAAPEDDTNETLAFRFTAAIESLDVSEERKEGALALIRDITTLPDGSPFVLGGEGSCVGKLRAECDRIHEDENTPDVGFICLDPLQAMLGKGASIMSVEGSRRIIAPLQALSREVNGMQGVAMAITHHTTKEGKVAGSQGLINAVRIAYMVSRVDDNARQRVISIFKTNISGDSAKTVYTIRGIGDATYVEYEDRAKLARERTAALKARTTTLKAPGNAHSNGTPVMWRTLRHLATGPEDTTKPIQVGRDMRSRDAAKVLASADSAALGVTLTWAPASSGPPGMEVATFQHGDARTTYAVHPVR